jgi:energy-coupling factor transporter ATP-binding protein EcfA2
MTTPASRQFAPDGDGSDNLKRDLEVVRGLRAAAGRRPLLDDLEGDLAAVEERALRAAVICLVGPTGAGKSTLLNALAGAEVAREGVDRPTTSTPVVYAPADLDEEIPGLEGEVEVVSYEPSPERPWSGHVLIDAPDVNSVRREHRETVRRLARISDVLVVVLHQQAVVEESTSAFVDAFADRRRVAVVLNRVDQLSERAAADVLAQVRSTAAERWGVGGERVFAISALRARQGDTTHEGFAQLVAWLAGLLDAGVVHGIRRANRSGVRRLLAGEVGRIRAAVAADFERLDLALADGWEAFAARTETETGRRLAARRADLELALGAELAKRWRGPGGWLLRVGMWGSVGSLGAFALRRNPLAAGALAVGGQVADRLRAAVAEHRIERASGVAPRLEDAAAWADEAFVQVRVDADALGGQVADGVLAGVAEAGEETIAAIEAAWGEVIELDLPEYVGSWRLSWFRLPLDLPLYALVLDVGQRTVRSYLTGGYLPLDYYVNALALAAVVAVVAAMAGRMVVAVAARAFLGRARRRVAEAIGRVCEAAVTRSRGVVADERGALERLAVD